MKEIEADKFGPSLWWYQGEGNSPMETVIDSGFWLVGLEAARIDWDAYCREFVGLGVIVVVMGVVGAGVVVATC